MIFVHTGIAFNIPPEHYQDYTKDKCINNILTASMSNHELEFSHSDLFATG